MAIARENGVSAYGVLMYVDFIFKAFFFGYSIAVTPVVGYHYGAQNHAELKSLLRKSLIITVLVSLVMTGASVTLAGPIADLFVGYDAALHDMTVNALRIYSVSFLVFGFNIFGSAFFTGLNDGTDSALISFLRTLVFQVAAILLLPRWLDINGIWLCRHRRGIAHAARHRFAPCREAEKISLLSRKIPAARREFSRNL